jgi:hypothetical protein
MDKGAALIHYRVMRCVFRVEGEPPQPVWAEDRETTPNTGVRIEHEGLSYIVKGMRSILGTVTSAESTLLTVRTIGDASTPLTS